MTRNQLDDVFAFFNEIGIIAQLSSNRMERAMPHALTMAQFSVLNWFSRVDDQATPGRLAAAFQVSKGAMTNSLGKLEDKGFVTVTPDPDSGRRKIVRRTAAGKKAWEAALASAFPVLETFADALGLDRIRAHQSFLSEVRAYLDADRE
jgi:DNA-binding MarR family transcriptional regulator